MNNKRLRLFREENHGAKDGKNPFKETAGIIEDVQGYRSAWLDDGQQHTIITVKGELHDIDAVIPAKIGDRVVLHYPYFLDKKPMVEGLQLLDDKGGVYYRYHQPSGASWLNTYFAE